MMIMMQHWMLFTTTKKSIKLDFVLALQNVLHPSPSCHLGVRGAGGLPSSPALDPRICYPGAQRSWQAWRQHLPPGGAWILILAVGGENCRKAAVWQARGSEVCSDSQTPQRQTCPGEDCYLLDWSTVQCSQWTFLKVESDILGFKLYLFLSLQFSFAETGIYTFLILSDQTLS